MRRAVWSVFATVVVLAWGTTTAAAAGWVGEAIPNPFLISNQVYGVSCARAHACEAVGQGFDAHWNGSTWQQQSDPGGGSFVAVSCPRALFCAAVGSGIAGHFNGATWSLDAFPISGNAVSCSRRTFCVAVGDSAAVWDGTSWSAQPPPVGGLSAVACRFCMAVGQQSNSSGEVTTLAELWNGVAWSIVPTPTPLVGTPGFTVFANLAGVSCRTARFCIATGVQTTLDFAPAVFAELWDGTSWHPIPAPFGDQARFTAGGSVSCPTSARCQAVGYTAIPVSTASFDLAAEFVR
jgi:hypothetical protein